MEFTGIYIYVDGSDLEAIVGDLKQRLVEWQANQRFDVRIIDDRSERTEDINPDDLTDWNLGLNIDRSHLTEKNLKMVVSFLYQEAVQFQRDFVLGYYDQVKKLSEDIVFFGHECGHKSAAQVASDFLGLSIK